MIILTIFCTTIKETWMICKQALEETHEFNSEMIDSLNGTFCSWRRQYYICGSFCFSKHKVFGHFCWNFLNDFDLKEEEHVLSLNVFTTESCQLSLYTLMWNPKALRRSWTGTGSFTNGEKLTVCEKYLTCICENYLFCFCQTMQYTF